MQALRPYIYIHTGHTYTQSIHTYTYTQVIHTHTHKGHTYAHRPYIHTSYRPYIHDIHKDHTYTQVIEIKLLLTCNMSFSGQVVSPNPTVVVTTIILQGKYSLLFILYNNNN